MSLIIFDVLLITINMTETDFLNITYTKITLLRSAKEIETFWLHRYL